MIKIDTSLLEKVSDDARKSDRLRMAYDLRTSSDDKSQRMLNAIEPGTEVPIHRHRNSSETCFVIRGAAIEIIYDDLGQELERIPMKSGSDCVGVNIPIGVWHKVVSIESGTIIFEAKDGKYEPLNETDIL